MTAVFQIPSNSAFINHPAVLTQHHVSQKSLYRNYTDVRGKQSFIQKLTLNKYETSNEYGVKSF